MSIHSSVTSEVIEGGSLSVIEVRSDPSNPRPLNTEALSTIAEFGGVVSVEPEVRGASIYGQGGWVMPVAAYQPSQPPPGETIVLETGQILVPTEAQGTFFSQFVGSEIDIQYTSRTGRDEGESATSTRHVIGTYDPSWQIYGADAAIMPFDDAVELVAAREGLTPEIYLTEYGVESALVRAEAVDHVAELVEAIRAEGFAADPLSDRLGRLPGVISLLPGAAMAAGVIAVLLVVVGVVTAVGGAVRTQLKDLALLRVNGWPTKDVRVLVIAESSWAVMLGAIWGCLLGAVASVVFSAWIGEVVGAFDVVSAATGAVVAAAAVFVVLFVIASLAAYFAARRSLRVDPYIAVQANGV